MIDYLIVMSHNLWVITYDVITSKNGPLDLQQRHSFFVDRQDMGSNIELFLDLSQMDNSEWSIRNGHRLWVIASQVRPMTMEIGDGDVDDLKLATILGCWWPKWPKPSPTS